MNEPEEPPTTADGRWVFSLSNAGFRIKGQPVQINKISKAELEKILGPADRIAPLEEGASDIALWDKKGLRAYFWRQTGVINDFDCCFALVTIEGLTDLEPKNPFDGVFKMQGVEITKATTKQALQESGRITQPMKDDAFGGGFHMNYGNTHASFSLESAGAQKTIRMVRITYTSSRG